MSDVYTATVPDEELQVFAHLWNKANHHSVNSFSHDANMRVDSPGNVHWNIYDSPSVNVSEFVVLALLSSPTILAKVKKALGV